MSFVWVSPYVSVLSSLMNGTYPIAGVMESVDCEPPGDIQVMIPYWIYRRICNLLVAVQSAAKPEDYIVAVLEGHVRRLNL